MEGYTTITNVAGDVVGGAMPPQMDGVPPHWNVYFNVEDADADRGPGRRARWHGDRAELRRPRGRSDGCVR